MRHSTVEVAAKAAGGFPNLAIICGLPKPTPYGWRFVPVWHVKRIAEATGLPVEALLPDGDDSKEKQP